MQEQGTSSTAGLSLQAQDGQKDQDDDLKPEWYAWEHYPDTDNGRAQQANHSP